MQNQIKVIETMSSHPGFDSMAHDFSVYLVTSDGKQALLRTFRGKDYGGIRYRHQVRAEAVAYVESISAIASPDTVWE